MSVYWLSKHTHRHTHTGNPSPSPSISGHFIPSWCDAASETLISGDTQCSSLSVMDYSGEKCAKSHLLRQITSLDLCCALRLARHPSAVTVSLAASQPSLALSVSLNSGPQLFCHRCKISTHPTALGRRKEKETQRSEGCRQSLRRCSCSSRLPGINIMRT